MAKKPKISERERQRRAAQAKQQQEENQTRTESSPNSARQSDRVNSLRRQRRTP